MTEILKDWPPNIRAIRAVLPVSERNIFAWGGIIYNPGGGPLSSELIKHEEVHFAQQRALDRWWRSGVKAWWKRFLRDPEFRLDQEIPAHRAEYDEFCRKNRDRNKRSRYLSLLGSRLSAEMYGSLLSHAEAMKAIR